MTTADLAAVAGISPFHFSRSFRGAVGLTPHRYVQARAWNAPASFSLAPCR